MLHVKSFLAVLCIILLPSTVSGGKEHYLLKTGKAASDRLERQHQTFLIASSDHLRRAGLSKGLIVWDIGCGNGAMTEYLAKKVGPDGHVYAIDISEAQLNVTKERIHKKGLTNVTFVHGDIAQLSSLPNSKPDLMYMRLVLMHQPNPQSIIKSLLSLLKTGGVVVSQESCIETAYPLFHFPVIRAYLNTVTTLGTKLGVDYNIGNKTAQLFQTAGFKNVIAYTTQQTLSTAEMKGALLKSLSEWKDKAINKNILDHNTAKQWEEALRALPDNNVPAFKTAQQTHVIARKSL